MVRPGDPSASLCPHVSPNSRELWSARLAPPQRVALTILKKPYAQRGTGRKESALYRGLDERHRALVPQVLRAIEAGGLAVRTRIGNQVIYLPTKWRRVVSSRVARPYEWDLGDDPPWIACAWVLLPQLRRGDEIEYPCPTRCPSCGSRLRWDLETVARRDRRLLCQADVQCPAQAAKRVVRILRRLSGYTPRAQRSTVDLVEAAVRGAEVTTSSVSRGFETTSSTDCACPSRTACTSANCATSC